MSIMTDKQFNDFTEDLIRNYHGNGVELSRAIGSLSIGRKMGWRVLMIMESEAVVRKHQKILGLRFKDVLPERGVYCHKSFGLKLVDKWDNFWDVVQGRSKEKITRTDKILFQ